MTTRHRARGAVIHQDRILMVRHVHDGRDYWTLPGGGRHTAHCFLMSAPRSVAVALGADPEQAHLEAGQRMLKEVAWRDLAEVADHFLVARVLALLESLDPASGVPETSA